MGTSSGNSRFRLTALLVLLLLVALLFEGGAYLAVRILNKSPIAATLFYQTPEVSREEYESYLSRRDPWLGWPPPDEIGGDMYDLSGSRPIPAFPQPGRECVSIYGDSFTYGSDVEHDEAWSNRLSQKLGCRVANFGVGGYGTDQAYLRFERNGADTAGITILGIFPTNVIRNLTRNAYFVFGVYPTAFKPRFSWADGELRRLPIPDIAVEELEDYLQDPSRFIEQDKLIPGTRFGPTLVGFPYSITLARAALHPRVLNWLRGRPSWIDYLQPGDSSTGHETLLGIVDHFVQSCAGRDRECMILLFSTPVSYDYYQSEGVSAFSEVIRALDERDIPWLDLGHEISLRYGDRPYCDLIAGPDSCVGHFNPEGNGLVAEIVSDFLADRGWLGSRSAD